LWKSPDTARQEWRSAIRASRSAEFANLDELRLLSGA
jgi:hypothetical protein